jgi:hypothetical protein
MSPVHIKSGLQQKVCYCIHTTMSVIRIPCINQHICHPIDERSALLTLHSDQTFSKIYLITTMVKTRGGINQFSKDGNKQDCRTQLHSMTWDDRYYQSEQYKE